jgi:UDP-N-acetylmuramoyl-tripeptide--D-alanyl-D-alanine ligase
VITNVGVAHIEHMGSREAIALEKGSLAEAVPAGGFVVLNAEDDFTAEIAGRCDAEVVTAGVGAGDFRAENLRRTPAGSEFVMVTPGGEQEVALPVPGRHMVGNALLAAAVGVRLGVSLESIAVGLSKVELTGGRLAQREIGGVSYLDDSYNANPDSVLAAIETLAGLDCDGRRFAVLGGMAELGDLSDTEHRRVGKAAAEAGIDVILSVGEVARPVCAGVNGSAPGHVEHFETAADCAAYLAAEASAGDLVLVKGSRSSAMEQIFSSLDNE